MKRTEPPAAVGRRSRTRDRRATIGPIPVCTARSGTSPWRTSRRWPDPSTRSACSAMKVEASASTASARRRRATSAQHLRQWVLNRNLVWMGKRNNPILVHGVSFLRGDRRLRRSPGETAPTSPRRQDSLTASVPSPSTRAQVGSKSGAPASARPSWALSNRIFNTWSLDWRPPSIANSANSRFFTRLCFTNSVTLASPSLNRSLEK